MKIPVEWLKQYIHSNKSAVQLAESFTNLGLMLDKSVTNYFSKDNKYKTEILDLEHRMDRADWLSLLGCARDLAAYENTNLKLPELYERPPLKLQESQKIAIKVDCPQIINRFNTRVFKRIKVKASPDWLRHRLEAYGIPSINNIVDITNYVMIELGQPMHAQDISKLEKPEIIIRMARKGEKITTLLGETVELDDQTFVLTQNDTPTVIGGIVGGISTGIDEATTEIVLDAGNYNQNNIRKTSRRLKIINETVLRYDKFLHTDLTEVAIKRATQLILELTSGEYYENVDWYPKKMLLKKQKLTLARLEQLGGKLDIKPAFVENVLVKLGYVIEHKDGESFTVEVPYFRTDVEVEDDVVSDILRIYGYSKIPLRTLHMAPPKDITPKIYMFEEKLRDICAGLGLHEHITDPLVTAQPQNANQVKLENSQSQLKNALRTNLYDGLVVVAENYHKHKINPVALFEIGKIYARKNASQALDDFSETKLLQVFYQYSELTTIDNSVEVRKILDGLLSGLGVGYYALIKEKPDVADTGIIVQGENCGYLGHDHFTLKYALLAKYFNPRAKVITEFENVITDDMSLVVPQNVDLGKIIELVKTVPKEFLDINIVPQEYAAGENTKLALLNIKHKLNNFSETRTQLIEKLKSELGVNTK